MLCSVQWSSEGAINVVYALNLQVCTYFPETDFCDHWIKLLFMSVKAFLFFDLVQYSLFLRNKNTHLISPSHLLHRLMGTYFAYYPSFRYLKYPGALLSVGGRHGAYYGLCVMLLFCRLVNEEQLHTKSRGFLFKWLLWTNTRYVLNIAVQSRPFSASQEKYNKEWYSTFPQWILPRNCSMRIKSFSSTDVIHISTMLDGWSVGLSFGEANKQLRIIMLFLHIYFQLLSSVYCPNSAPYHP